MQIELQINTAESTYPALKGVTNTGEVSDGLRKAIGEAVGMTQPDTWTTAIAVTDTVTVFKTTCTVPKSIDDATLRSRLRGLGVCFS